MLSGSILPCRRRTPRPGSRRASVLQGNLDPVLLLTGGAALEAAARELRQSLGGGRWIFNLGHGVLTETPPEHVTALARVLTLADGLRLNGAHRHRV